VRYGVKYHLNSNAIQLYISGDPEDKLNISGSLENLEDRVADIRLWKYLKRNDENKNMMY